MTRAWTRTWTPLVAAAQTALTRSAGRPRRGAAIEDQDGVIYPGASLAPPDLPAASLCAEHAALAALCASGSRVAQRLVVIGLGSAGAPPPCGRCLQILREFAPALEIRWGTPTAERGRSDLRRLLPDPFDDYRQDRIR
jgi:cytidine deaminase